MDLSMSDFGKIHALLSVVALISGLIVVKNVLASRRSGGLTALYLATTLATGLTALKFLSGPFGAPHVLTFSALFVTVAAIVARYVFHAAGAWRAIYAVTAVFGVYFLVFFTIAESFKRVGVLHALAPTLSELPFNLVQLAALLIFVTLAIAAARRFHYVRD
jgi:hypothetical protein